MSTPELPDPADQASGVEPSGLHRTKPASPRWRKVTAVALAVVVLVVAAVAGYFWYLNHIVSGNIEHADLLPPGNGAKGKGQNILLIGTDTRPSDVAENRSDVIILAHVDADYEQVHLVHFPRDLAVTIPGRKGVHKINAAYEYGGAKLLAQTLQQILGGTSIDRVALVQFTSFARMTDSVGGVDVRVIRDFDRNGIAFRRGLQHMNGETALTFVRERKSFWQGDVIRGKHQMYFLKALARQSLAPEVVLNPNKLRNLLEAASRDLVLDRGTSIGDLRSLAFKLRGLKGTDIVAHSAPVTGTGRTPGGRYLVTWDPAEMEQLGQALSDDTMDDLDLPERRLTPPAKNKR